MTPRGIQPSTRAQTTTVTRPLPSSITCPMPASFLVFISYSSSMVGHESPTLLRARADPIHCAEPDQGHPRRAHRATSLRRLELGAVEHPVPNQSQPGKDRLALARVS